MMPLYQGFYRGMQLGVFPIFAMLLFFATFCVVLALALFRRSDQARVEATAHLPLLDDHRRTP